MSLNSNSKNSIANVYYSIQGKVIAMVIFFLICFTVFTIWNSYKNSRLKDISEKTINFRMPVTLNANSILSGLNRVSASQRGYIMTKQKSFRAERLMVWDSQIKPAFGDLMEKRNQLSSEENKLRLDTLNQLLNEYFVIQDDIDNFVTQNLNYDENEHISIDSTNLLETVQKINETRGKNRALQAMIKEEASPIRKKMRALLQPLAQKNNEYIKNEISSVNDNWEIFIALLSILISIIIGVSMIFTLKKSIKKPVKLLNELASGKAPEYVTPTKDELGSIIKAGNTLADNMKKASSFALEVGEGNFEQSFETLGKEDILGNTLVKMRNQLRDASEKERSRLWLTEGIAQINKILREDINGKEWYMEIISFLLSYLNANVGGIYLIEEKEGDEKVNLKACIAYNREKFNEVSVGKYEGLIGSCIFEKKSVYLKNMPDNYLNITSGLGDAPPKCLLLLPLKNNGLVIGVLELASLSIFNEDQLDFLEKISESIGAALTSKQNNEKTKNLLDISKSKTEELQAVEEVLRQNNEELMVTQEKLANQERALAGKLDAINKTVAIIEFQLNGKVNTANRKFLELMGYDLNEIVDQHHSIFCDAGYAGTEAYKKFWEDLNKGKLFSGEVQRVNKFGKKVNLIATYYPQYNSNKELKSVYKIAYLASKSVETKSAITENNS